MRSMLLSDVKMMCLFLCLDKSFSCRSMRSMNFEGEFEGERYILQMITFFCLSRSISITWCSPALISSADAEHKSFRTVTEVGAAKRA